MIRKISLEQLIPGMYVVDLHKSWLEHNFWRRRFFVRDTETISRLREQGISEVSIDLARGLDVPVPQPPGTLSEVEKKFLSLADRVKERPRMVSLGEERRRAGRLLRETDYAVQTLMRAAGAGVTLNTGQLEPLIAKMVESISRNPDALVPLARLKQMGSYASEHAVATAALMIALARQMNKPEPEVEKLALGTLLKDIGLASLDSRLMAKPGELSREEQSLVQRHVEEGLSVLEATSRLAETSVAVILEHHERFDGLGYPFRMSGGQITEAGRMAAIVDTYDAMTSDRPWRPALSPSDSLSQVFAQGGRQFDPDLVAAFVKTVGIYPVGTLVLLESGHLAVVEEVRSDNLLTPIVRVIYHAGRRQFVTPVQADLSRTIGNHYGKIVRAESYERWGLNPLSFQPA